MRSAAPVLALALAACGLFDATSDATSTDTDVATGTTTPTGGPPPCITPDDCPAPAPCELVTCEDDACIYAPRPEGEVADDVPGDCRTLVCDGAGAGVSQVDDADPPDDANDCTDDVCDDGQPANPARPVGSPCEGAKVCHADLTCQPCPERTACGDESPHEPNETQSKAAALPLVRDDDDAAYLCETLGSPGDVDWFTFTAVDTALGAVAPALTGVPDDAQVCAYFQCSGSGTAVVCPEGTVEDDAPLGQQGCCGHGTFEPYIDCKGLSEDATVWMRVAHDSADPPQCLNYQLGYVY